MPTNNDDDDKAEWAENKMRLKANSATALTGAAAKAYGAAVLAGALGTGPEIPDYPTPGTRSHTTER